MYRTRVCNELEVRARFCEDDHAKEILQRLWNNEKTIRRPKDQVWKIEPLNNDQVNITRQDLLLHGMLCIETGCIWCCDYFTVFTDISIAF